MLAEIITSGSLLATSNWASETLIEANRGSGKIQSHYKQFGVLSYATQKNATIFLCYLVS